MKRRLYRIEGRVRGVWFRESTRREATALGITGYAKNMADGMVQVTNVEWSVMESECLHFPKLAD